MHREIKSLDDQAKNWVLSLEKIAKISEIILISRFNTKIINIGYLLKVGILSVFNRKVSWYLSISMEKMSILLNIREKNSSLVIECMKNIEFCWSGVEKLRLTLIGYLKVEKFIVHIQKNCDFHLSAMAKPQVSSDYHEFW